MAWLTVRNWGEYQHYGDRRPPWLKVHISVRDDPQLNVCHPTARLLFFMLLITAAETDNVIPYKRAWIAEEVRLPVQAVTRHLPALIQAQFLLEHASEPKGFIASKIASAAASRSASASHTHRAEAETKELREERLEEPPLQAVANYDATAADENSDENLKRLEELSERIGRSM